MKVTPLALLEAVRRPKYDKVDNNRFDRNSKKRKTHQMTLIASLKNL